MRPPEWDEGGKVGEAVEEEETTHRGVEVETVDLRVQEAGVEAGGDGVDGVHGEVWHGVDGVGDAVHSADRRVWNDKVEEVPPVEVGWSLPETTLRASGTEWTNCWPVWKAVLPVWRTRWNGVRRTSYCLKSKSVRWVWTVIAWVICWGDLTTLEPPLTPPAVRRDNTRTASWEIDRWEMETESVSVSTNHCNPHDGSG